MFWELTLLLVTVSAQGKQQHLYQNQNSQHNYNRNIHNVQHEQENTRKESSRYNSHYCRQNYGCTNNCDSGWFGPLCDYENLADFSSEYLLRQINSGCQTNRFVYEITFKLPHSFTWIRIQFPSNGKDYINSLNEIRFQNNAEHGEIRCDYLRIYELGGNKVEYNKENTYDIYCTMGQTANTIFIEFNTAVAICNIFISGGRNVAFQQVTNQSSTYQDSEMYYSKNAVDGSRSGKIYDLTCAHTDKDLPSYWSVRFDRPHLVYRYVIYNRDSEKVRIQGFKLTSYYKGRIQFSYVDDSQTPKDKYIITSPVIIVDEVKITQQLREYFTICEVEVYGDIICPQGTYNINCSMNCNCENSPSCFVNTGGCPHHCPKTYMKNYCHQEQNLACHCEDGRCNPSTGQCLHNFGCEDGWFGPSCQYQNLATREFLKHGSSVKVDQDNCSEVSTHLDLVFTQEYSFNWMRFHINSRKDDLLKDFQLKFSKNESSPFNEVKNITFYNLDSHTLDISFIVNETAKYLKIEWRNKVHICGFYLSGGRNIAFNQQTVQTSTYDSTKSHYTAMKAVDGNTDSNALRFSCSHTGDNDNKPIWTLTLQAAYSVNRYAIYNRQDKKELQKGFTLSSIGKTSVFSYKANSEVKDIYRITSAFIEITMVNISLSQPHLCLCEVQIFGDSLCPSGTFGFKCEKLCHCKNNVSCFGVTGACPDGCADGYGGQDCQEVKQSDLMCHCTNGLCDPITGRCLHGGNCKNGWFGPGCQFENLATDKHALSAFSGDRSNCSDPLNNVTLQFKKTISFTWMRIHLNHSQSDVRKALKSVEFKKDQQSIDCINIQVYKVDVSVIDVACELTGKADWIEIKWHYTVSLCKLYISGGRNIAFKQRANQSSTYDELNLTADKAVDGNTDQEVYMKSCSHTGDKDRTPNWSLDLNNTFAVNRYVLYNRNSNKERLIGSTLTSYSKDSQVFRVRLTSEQDLYNETSSVQKIDKVIISSTQLYLTLCEVQIFGDSDCSNGTFGFRCEKTCHCKNNASCHVATGGCPNGCAIGYTGEDCQQETKLICRCIDGWCNPLTGECSSGVDCMTGWFGPACQYQNLLTQQDIVNNDAASNSLDKASTNCSNPSTSIPLQFNTSYSFTWIRIKGSSSENDIPIKFQDIMLSNFSTNEIVKCEPHLIYKYNNYTVDIVCHGNTTAKGLIINWKENVTICDVYISGGRNIAFKQQSKSLISIEPSCPSESGQSLSIELDHPYLVNRYLIHRNKSLPDCFTVKGFRENQTVFSCSNNASAQDFLMVTSVPENVTKINVFSCEEELSLANIEVYGEIICREGFFGLFCEKECHCKNLSCFVVTGACIGKCANGYTGDHCQQVCPSGYWGDDCLSQCNSLCNDTNNCDHMTGACIGGCKEYYKSPNCTECADGYWGDKCNESCSEHCSQKSCDRYTSQCHFGCNDGYVGDKCSQECLATLWGKDCLQICSSNCVSGDCYHVTGHCHGGCKAGYQFPSCNIVCQAGFWKFNCSETCSPQCLDPKACDPFNGKCVGGCKAGYRLDNCTAKCEKGFYGNDCNNSCPVNCNNSDCHHEIGKCNMCKPGYYSNRGTSYEQSICHQACAKYYYGDGCKYKCSSNCSESDCYHDTGNCKSCIDGMEGLKCDQIKKISVAAYVVPIVLFLILGILAGIYLYRRHEQRKLFYSDGDIFATFPVSARGRKNNEENKRERQNIYNNTSLNLDGKHTLIPLNLLNSYLGPLNQQHYIDQFKKIPEPRDVTFTAGMSEANRVKNRYRNICPYDHSRVHLHLNKEKQQGDYINASFVKGYKSRELFIASQGPNAACIKDFIRMLWERNIEKVIMLTNLVEEGKLKCDKYWPDVGSVTVGEIQITLTAIQIYADYTVRHLELKKSKRVRSVIQFHFTAWPDKWVPLTHWGLVDFHQRVFAVHTSKATVVHCSAGVGRTGTFIALHNAIKQGEDVGHVDFYNTAVKLRRDRMLMIQTAKQYEFLHKAAYVAFSCLNTIISAENVTERLQSMDMRSISGVSPLEKEFDDVCKIVSELEDDHDDPNEGDDIENSAMNYQNTMKLSDLKNRFPEVSPKKIYTVLLSGDKFTDTYINAVFVPSLVKANHYILTQLPMHATVVDFWRMVTQYRVSLVVEVELESTVGDKTIGKYLPSDNENFIKVQPFEINTELVERNKLWKEQIVTVATANLSNHQLTHLKSSVTSLDPSLLLDLVIKLRTLLKNKYDRVVYMCRNGAQYSGLIYLLTLLLDRMDDDHKVSIPLVVGSGKSIRPQIIPSLDQYRCLYQVVHAYIQSSHSTCHYVNAALIQHLDDTQIDSDGLFSDMSCDEQG